MLKKIKQRDINFHKGTLLQSPRTSLPAHQALLFSDNMAQHRRGSSSLAMWRLKRPRNLPAPESWVRHFTCAVLLMSVLPTPRLGEAGEGRKLGHWVPLIKRAPESGFPFVNLSPPVPMATIFFIKSKNGIKHSNSQIFPTQKYFYFGKVQRFS